MTNASNPGCRNAPRRASSGGRSDGRPAPARRGRGCQRTEPALAKGEMRPRAEQSLETAPGGPKGSGPWSTRARVAFLARVLQARFSPSIGLTPVWLPVIATTLFSRAPSAERPVPEGVINFKNLLCPFHSCALRPNTWPGSAGQGMRCPGRSPRASRPAARSFTATIVVYHAFIYEFIDIAVLNLSLPLDGTALGRLDAFRQAGVEP